MSGCPPGSWVVRVFRAGLCSHTDQGGILAPRQAAHLSEPPLKDGQQEFILLVYVAWHRSLHSEFNT